MSEDLSFEALGRERAFLMNEEFTQMAYEDLESRHRAVDSEIAAFLELKQKLHDEMERRRPVKAPSFDAHRMGG